MSINGGSYSQAQLASEDYIVDLTSVLGLDTISAVTWEASPASIDITTTAPTYTSTTITVWPTGGVLGQLYRLKAKVTTTSGRIYSVLMRILITA